MKKQLILAVAASTVLLLAGCSASHTNTSSDSASSKVKLVDQTPAATKSVAKVTWALPAGEPPSLDPIKVGADSGYMVLANLCENILTLHPNFSMTPNLATSANWTSPTKFVIDVKSGIKFWDGTTMTAEDVAYSLNRSADAKAGSINASTFSDVTSIDVTGTDQVTLTFSQHNSQFRNDLATTAGVVVEKAWTEAHLSTLGTASGGLMCSGPYQLKSWTPGEKIVTTSFSDYHGGAPLTKELDYVFVSSDSTLTNGLLSGEIDGSFSVPVASEASLSKSSVGTFYGGPSTASAAIASTTATGPAANPKVREALDLAIDKNALIKAVFAGYGAPQKSFISQLAFQGLPDEKTYQAGYDALPDKTYDLAKAKKLISSVDLSKKTLVLAIEAGSTEWSQIATIVQAAGASIGLTIKIKQLQGTDYANLFYGAENRKGYDLVGVTGYQVGPGVLTYTGYIVGKDGLFNWNGYSNSTVLNDYQKALTTSNDAEAAKSFVSAQKIFAKDDLQISLANEYARTFVSKKLTGVTTSFAYISSPWALHLGAK